MPLSSIKISRFGSNSRHVVRQRARHLRTRGVSRSLACNDFFSVARSFAAERGTPSRHSRGGVDPIRPRSRRDKELPARRVVAETNAKSGHADAPEPPDRPFARSGAELFVSNSGSRLTVPLTRLACPPSSAGLRRVCNADQRSTACHAPPAAFSLH